MMSIRSQFLCLAYCFCRVVVEKLFLFRVASVLSFFHGALPCYCALCVCVSLFCVSCLEQRDVSVALCFCAWSGYAVLVLFLVGSLLFAWRIIGFLWPLFVKSGF